jgi:hypothetical protein
MTTVNAINIGIYIMVLHLIQRKPTLIQVNCNSGQLGRRKLQINEISA